MPTPALPSLPGAGARRYDAHALHNLSKAGKPLLVKYDYDKARATLTRDELARRPNTMWKWREILPVTKTENCVYLGEECAPRKGGREARTHRLESRGSLSKQG